MAGFRPRLEALEDRFLPSTLTVSNIDDSGPGSLRGAIAAAKSGDTIVFDPSLTFARIVLFTGELAINKSLDIEGPNKGFVYVENPYLSRPNRIFDIVGGVKVTLARLDIQGGFATQGGGILNQGSTVMLSHCTIEDNIAVLGGGIYNAGTLTVAASGVDGNQALGATSGSDGMGGGIYNAAGANLKISNSNLNGNDAGGAVGGQGNRGGAGLGGGIYEAGGVVAVVNSSFGGNEAVGFSDQIVNPSPSLFGAGLGGAIYIAGGNLTLSNSDFFINLVAGGVASGGAIFQAAGTVNASNCTFDTNGQYGTAVMTSADFFGGAVFVEDGSLTVTKCDFSNNQATGSDHGIGGAIYITGGSVCISSNTTFLSNFASTSNNDIFGPFTIC